MKKLVYIICFTFLFFGCSKSSVDDGEQGKESENPNENPNVGNELMVNLLFPHKDGLCNLGTNLTPTESTVFFEWQTSNVAENYTIFIENLNNGNIIQDQTTENIIGVIIDRATPYAWYVESTSGTNIEKSETWKFYNAGPGVQTYAPFPAALIAPAMASTVNATGVTLQWSGSDVDDDISGYDVYFGTNNNPESFAIDLTVSELNVSVTSGIIYYWKIITKDSSGNTSESDIFQFKVL